MRYKKTLIVILIILAMALGACCSYSEGIVVSKEHQDERYYIGTVYYPIPIQNNMYDDEDYIVVLRCENDKNDEYIMTLYVSEHTYDSLHIGDLYILPENYCELTRDMDIGVPRGGIK